MMPRSESFAGGRKPGTAQQSGFVGSILKFWRVRIHMFQDDFEDVVDPRVQTSYAADYVGLLLLLTAYMLVSPIFSEYRLALIQNRRQCRSFVQPFHRMFSLDDIAIQFPHALVERVPPGTLEHTYLDKFPCVAHNS